MAFFAASQLFLQLYPVRDVADVQDDRTYGRVGENIAAHRLHESPGAILLTKAVPTVQQLIRAFQESGVCGQRRRPVFGVNVVEAHVFNHLFGRVSEDSFGCGTDVPEGVVRVDNGDDVRRVLRQDPVAFLALLEFLFQPLALRHVAVVHDEGF